MTENEAIEVFTELLNVPCEMLIKYDSVTTEEQKKALVRVRDAEETAIKVLEEIQQYRALGTVEELREVTEKQRAKKPKTILRHRGGFEMEHCPNCDTDYQVDRRYMINDDYCPTCGKLLDSAFKNFCGNCGQAIEVERGDRE